MPASIEVDITRLVDMDSAITVADLEIPAGVTVLTPMDADVVRPAIAAVEIEEEELELGEEEMVEGVEKAGEGAAPEEGGEEA